VGRVPSLACCKLGKSDKSKSKAAGEVARVHTVKNMAHKVTLIPGDGIGPEVMQATVRILQATGVKFDWEIFQVGAEAYAKYHEYIPKELIESVERTRVGLKGPVTTPVGEGFPSINVALRKKFELYANFRPIRNLPHIPTRYPGVDLIIVRENTESLYSGIEHEVVPGVVESLKIITEKASTRIARFAFEYSRKNHRKKIHAIHKANIMKLSDGLFLRCCRDVAREYPEITYGEHIVDNTCMQLVMNPYQYDVLVMENLYGDIISDLCAAFVGGLGFVPSANLGDNCAIFEAVHGSAPDIAGKDLANPTAVIRSAQLMLRHLGEHHAADKIHDGLEKVYRTKDKLTRDVGGKAGTSEFADAIIQFMETSTDVPAQAESSHA
jgi:isocitrate dehydrogenase (NAD+)